MAHDGWDPNRIQINSSALVASAMIANVGAVCLLWLRLFILAVTPLVPVVHLLARFMH